MEEKELIRIQWRVDRSQEPVLFLLEALDPAYGELKVQVEASEKMPERRAKAVLMQEMYELGISKGIEPKRLRFKINGLDD